MGISAYNKSSSSSFPMSTSARNSPTVSMSSPMGATSRFKVFVGLTSALLCHSRFPAADCSSLDNAQRRSNCCDFTSRAWVEIQNVFEIEWEEFARSIPVHQVPKMNCHSLTNFAVNRTHVSTIVSEVEILSSFARDFWRTAQHFVCTSESSIQRSEQSVFVVSLELSICNFRNPFTTGSPIVQWEEVHCSFCVQFHFHPFKPLRTTGGTGIQTSK